MRYRIGTSQKTYENIYRYIQWCWETYQRGPTVREIAKAVNLSSPATVQEHLDRMVYQGYLTKDPASHRTVQVVKGALPHLCSHDWRVSSNNGSILSVICVFCEHKTEKEYKPDPENPETWLRFYE